MYAQSHFACPDCGEFGRAWSPRTQVCSTCRGRLAAATKDTVGSNFLACIQDLANPITEMVTLAVAIADQGARFDIQWACNEVVLSSGQWLDTSISGRSAGARQLQPEEQCRMQNQLVRAQRYLLLRGQLQRNTAYASLVRFIDEDQPAEPADS